jgi:hypothetical protein
MRPSSENTVLSEWGKDCTLDTLPCHCCASFVIPDGTAYTREAKALAREVGATTATSTASCASRVTARTGRGHGVTQSTSLAPTLRKPKEASSG